jgi:putative peptidoglycan lipid II flippase
MLSRGYYALSDTRTPVMFAVGAMLVNLALAAALVGPMEISGLALALSIAATLEFGALFIVLMRRIPALQDESLIQALSKMALAAAVMATAITVTRIVLEVYLDIDTERGWSALLVLAAALAIGGTAYLATASRSGLSETGMILNRLTGFLRRA